jgi:mercuric ion transport protein
MNAKQILWASALSAVGASLCCVAPLVLVLLGLGGAWVASFAALEPARPIFVGLTLGLLWLAWRRLYRAPPPCATDGPCAGDGEDSQAHRRQRLAFWLTLVPLLLLLGFPWIAPLFY